MSARQAIRHSLGPAFHRKNVVIALIVAWLKFAAFMGGGATIVITKSQRSDSRPLYQRSLSLTG